jgi:hypothetical protein
MCALAARTRREHLVAAELGLIYVLEFENVG